MRNRVITILFCLLLAAGIGLHLFLPDRAYSGTEKRLLKQLPALPWADVRSGRFGDEIEEYLADQFPGRDAWVTVKTLAERLFGKRESGGVYFADDGYLIEIRKTLDAGQAEANLAALKKLQDALAEKGIPIRLMLVPTASDILSDKLPAFAPNADQQAVIARAKELGLNVTDVREALRTHSAEYIYYKTDHHWTSLGAYYAWAAWMEDRGEVPDPISAWTRERLCGNFRGTTWAKVNDLFAAWDTIDAYYKTERHTVDYNGGWYVTDSIYERKYLDGSDQYAVFLNSNQATAVVSGSGTGKLLILKDSYANCFAQFCADDWAETHLIDLRFFRGTVRNYIAEHGITEVLVLYNVPNFTEDAGLARCAAGLS